MRQETVEIAELALFKKVAEASPDFIGICDADLNPVFVNPAGLRISELTMEEARTLSVPEYFIDSEQDFVAEHVLPTALHEGEWSGELHLKKFKSGDRTPILYSVFRVDHPLTGKPAYLATISRDLTQQKADEERKLLLLNELDHRVKNMLAVIQSISTQTFKPPRSIKDSLSVFLGRLQALAASHEALGTGKGERADLRQVIDIACQGAGVAKGRYEAKGPKISLSPRLAQTLTMILHELCTNAMKYGALSNERGSVSIRWACDRDYDNTLDFTWQEKNGPAVKQPEQAGFGSKLITSTIAVEKHGSADFDYAPTGLVFNLSVSLD